MRSPLAWMLALALLIAPVAVPAQASDHPDEVETVEVEEEEQDVEEEEEPETCDAGEVHDAARDDCVEDPATCDPTTEYYDNEKGECEEKDDLPADCDADEVYDAASHACVDDPTACDDDESWNATRADCVEDPASCDPATEYYAPGEEECEEKDDLEGECDADEVYNATRYECEDDPAACDDDETWNSTRAACIDHEFEHEHETEFEDDADDEDIQGCDVRETETRREETFANGTRYEERTRLRVLDCPEDDRDRVLKNETKVRWKSDSSGPGPASRVTIERVNDKLRIDVDLPSHDGAEADALEMTDNASVLNLKDKADKSAAQVTFLEVIEFEDLNGDGAYDLDDAVLAAWRIGALEANASTSEDGTLKIVYDLPPGGRLAFVYHEPENARAKFDIAFSGFAYSSETSQLALRSAFAAKNAAYHADRADPALVAEDDGRLAVFDWKDEVVVDGVEHPVLATVYLGEGAAEGTAQLYLSYPRGEEILHDPSLGFVTVQSVAVAKQVLLHPASYAVAALVAVVFVAGGWLARKRN